MKYFMCGQTGNINRGCEAIVRSTVKILNQKNGDVYVATFAPDQDRKMCRELGISMISYAAYPSKLHRYFFAGIRKIFKGSLMGLSLIEKPLFEKIRHDDVCLTIGGDTYCYGRPLISLALNDFTFKKGIKNILWCCSVEKDVIQGEVLRDLKKYECIFAREYITYNNLIEAKISESKIVKCCDPAFFLDAKEVMLPEKFVPGNTVGINVSELVINETNPCVYQNVIELINHILNNTDMSICLIPHVYSIKNNSNDYPILKKIYEEVNNDRVSIIDREYTCEQLKFIISKCRFFVGARTHSTIAAYSSMVPTLVLGYSVKSKGIATDLFGTYENYVLPYNELRGKRALVEAFEVIVEKEYEIKERLKAFLPEYKKTLTDAVEKYVINKKLEEKPFEICDTSQCTGCLACTSVCPKKCISIKENEEGFWYPCINFEKCINCGLCKKKCPVENKPKDDNNLPKTFASVNKDKDVQMNSSSGGVFTALAEYVLNQGGVVYGAGFDLNFNVVHKCCTTKEELSRLRGSKYVQSNVEGVYAQVEEFLKNGRTVLFTGTPCQIGGLYAFLGNNYDKLYTMDFICHGVPSPKVWKKYVSYRKSIAKSEVKNISFRNKNTGWKTYSVAFEFENGSVYSKKLTEDLYMRGYLSHLFLRLSCSECSFKQVHRQSDITLADFWGVENTLPAMKDLNGVSLIMLQSSKGEELFEQIKESLNTKQIDFESAIRKNQSMLLSVRKNPLRKRFFKDTERLPMDRLIEKYCGVSIISRLRRKTVQYFGSR